MKKSALLIICSIIATYTFAENEKKSLVLHPMDKVEANILKSSNASEFVKRYTSEAKEFLKKGEFETTEEYQNKIDKNFKPKSLEFDKIYAFKMDSILIKYNPDKSRYEVITIEDPTIGNLFGKIYMNFNEEDMTIPKNGLRISKLNRKTDQYKASNAYGKSMNVIRTRGKDFYISTSKPFSNVYDNALIFPVNIETAKSNAKCEKEVYVFGKLNGKAYINSDYDFAALSIPKIDYPLDTRVEKVTVPIDIVGMTLKCTKGNVISTYISDWNSSKSLQEKDSLDISRNSTGYRRLKIE